MEVINVVVFEKFEFQKRELKISQVFWNFVFPNYYGYHVRNETNEFATKLNSVIEIFETEASAEEINSMVTKQHEVEFGVKSMHLAFLELSG